MGANNKVSVWIGRLAARVRRERAGSAGGKDDDDDAKNERGITAVNRDLYWFSCIKLSLFLLPLKLQ